MSHFHVSPCGATKPKSGENMRSILVEMVGGHCGRNPPPLIGKMKICTGTLGGTTDWGGPYAMAGGRGSVGRAIVVQSVAAHSQDGIPVGAPGAHNRPYPPDAVTAGTGSRPYIGKTWQTKNGESHEPLLHSTNILRILPNVVA
jgi:hypothetical protein